MRIQAARRPVHARGAYEYHQVALRVTRVHRALRIRRSQFVARLVLQ